MAKKTQTVKYKFKPPVVAIAKQELKVLNFKQERDVIKAVSRGKTYEAIAEKLGITVDEVHAIAQRTIKKWAGEIGQVAETAKVMDLRRLDDMLDAIHDKVFPEPFIDLKLGIKVYPDPDPIYVKLYLEIIDRRRAMLGTDAAKKMEAKGEIELFERKYIGVSPDEL